MDKWISLAVSNRIPLKHLGSLPLAQQYLRNCATPRSANVFSKFVTYVTVLYYPQ